MQQWDLAHDVVVLGSGAGGLVAALAAAEAGADVGLFEKADRIGGTTAISGGTVWIPDNRRADWSEDSAERSREYLRSISLGLIDDEFIDTFVAEGAALVDWLESVSPLRFEAVRGFPDYHPEHPGGLPDGGRSLDPLLYPFAELGEWADRVVVHRVPPRARLVETPLGGGTGRVPRALVDQRAVRDERGCGSGLVGPLLKAVLDRGVTPVTDARAEELVREDGRVVGVVVAMPEGRVRVRARRGVVVATGGFEWDPDLVRRFLRGPMTAPASVPTNTGDGLRMGMRIGADLGNMSEAWWVPAVQVPGDEAFGHPRSVLVLRERTLPRSILVNRTGRRFADEAANYNAFGGALHLLDPVDFDFVNLPFHLVFDQGYVDEYGFLGKPGHVPDWVPRADTPHELAGVVGVPGEALRATIDRWNEMVAAGRDEDFRRGESAYDRWCGDRRVEGPATTLGPLDRGPYYAVPLHPGCLGTKGGLRTDLDGRVHDVDGRPIEGLYAVGNVAASPTGRSYVGGGGTLGPIMLLARRAGVHVAGA